MSSIRRERLLLFASLAINCLLLVALIGQLGKMKLAEIQAQHALREAQESARRLAEWETKAESRPAPVAGPDADQLELARLRNEVTRLRRELATPARTNHIAAPRSAAPAPPPAAAPVPALRKLTSQASVNLPLGQTLAVGGWTGERPGERILSFVTPGTDPAAPGSVLVQSHLISVPDRLLERLGLQDLRTDENASQAAAALDAARFAALLKFAEGENGVSVLSAPRVLTGNGQAAQISVRQTQPDGSATGPALSLTPTLDATGTSVRLDVNLELNLPASPRP